MLAATDRPLQDICIRGARVEREQAQIAPAVPLTTSK